MCTVKIMFDFHFVKSRDCRETYIFCLNSFEDVGILMVLIFNPQSKTRFAQMFRHRAYVCERGQTAQTQLSLECVMLLCN